MKLFYSLLAGVGRGFPLILTLLISCVHDPIIDGDGQVDDLPSSDTVKFVINTQPCEEGVVYFENEVLPIFVSNCAISGCHDQNSASDGVVLTDYNSIRRGIAAGNPGGSEYYEVLVEGDSEDLMPRKPGTEMGFSLPQDQIATIRSWILQGARNNYCDECDTTQFAFNTTILPMIRSNCATSSGCHGSGSINGVFTSYEGIKPRADNGLIEQKAIVYKNMPPASPLPDCDMLLLKKWLDAGAPNN